MPKMTRARGRYEGKMKDERIRMKGRKYRGKENESAKDMRG